MASEFVAEIASARRQTGGKCTVGPALARLSPEERAAVDDALAEDLPASAIATWLRQPPRNLSIGDGSLRRHLAGGCKCPTP